MRAPGGRNIFSRQLVSPLSPAHVPSAPLACPGALRAEKPELLTVVLPQSRSKQPPESQELLLKALASLLASTIFALSR